FERGARWANILARRRALPPTCLTQNGRYRQVRRDGAEIRSPVLAQTIPRRPARTPYFELRPYATTLGSRIRITIMLSKSYMISIRRPAIGIRRAGWLVPVRIFATEFTESWHIA